MELGNLFLTTRGDLGYFVLRTYVYNKHEVFPIKRDLFFFVEAGLDFAKGIWRR